MDEVHYNDQQYFPTYNLSSKAEEVALREYELSGNTLNIEEKSLNVATSFLLGLVGFLAAFVNGNVEKLKKLPDLIFDSYESASIFFLMIFIINLSAVSYFAEARKSVVQAGRKIIVLRRMLGLSYGSIEAVLPSNRLEGANEPYHLRVFHGWFSPKALPAYCIASSTGIIIWVMLLISLKNNPDFLFEMRYRRIFPVSVSFFWFFLTLYIYRIMLLDQHETSLRILSELLAKFLSLPLTGNFEYIIYRAKLSVLEAQRLKVPVSQFRRFIVEIEDRKFYEHNGFSVFSILSSIFRYIERGKTSGGSTITQQLARSLFIKSSKSILRRKIIEICLSIWIEEKFTKNQILDMYICSVRFETGVYGAISAIKYFYPTQEKFEKIDSAMIFLLCERIANIRSKLLLERIKANAAHLAKKGVIDDELSKTIINQYLLQIFQGRIKTTNQQFIRFISNPFVFDKKPSSNKERINFLVSRILQKVGLYLQFLF